MNRTIELDPAVDDFIARSREANPQFEKRWQGAEWRLLRNPMEGVPYPHSQEQLRLLVIPMNITAKLMPLSIMYSFAEPCICVLRVQFGEWLN